MCKQVLDVSGNKINQYRKIGSSLLVYTIELDAYVCCYTCAGKNKNQLIAAYENQAIEN